MKGKTYLAFWILAFAFLVVLIALVADFRFEFYKGKNCKPIYVNDYHFICCVKDKNPQSISGKIYSEGILGIRWYAPVMCPPSAVECSYIGDTEVYVYTDCYTYKPLLSDIGWKCEGKITQGKNIKNIKPGQWVWTKDKLKQISIFVYNKKLVDCGSAGCEQGVTIPGSHGCTFKTDLRVYDENGNLKSGVDPESIIAYTVPYGECWYYTTPSLRHIAGDTCEECKSDDDCIEGHSFKYYYKGKWYGAEAVSATKLSLYGCKNYGKRCVNKDVLPGGAEKCFAYAIESRCEEIMTVDVQCVPGSSICGPNAFCDPETFTCKKTTECQYDWECGTQTICDSVNHVIKIPKCIKGKCGFEEKPVECCYDSDCPSGYYCAQDHKCKESGGQKTECPYECCVNEKYYFDKLCPNNEQCINNKCQSFAVCDNDGRCETDKGENQYNCPSDCGGWNIPFGYIILALIPIVSALMGFLKGKENKKIHAMLYGLVGAIISIILYLVAEFIAKNWLMLLLGGIGGLTIFYLLGGFGFIAVLIMMALNRG